MKYDQYLYVLLNKYISCAKFDWCLLICDQLNNKMFAYDLEEKKRRSISYVITLILENGMLDECFTQGELEMLHNLVPKRFKKEIEYYVTTM